MTAKRLALLRQTARKVGDEYRAGFAGAETGEPCPDCKGAGEVDGLRWPEEVLAKWPRKPCVVLDPMAGSGQTGMAALDLNRHVILNDLNPDYADLCRERLAAWPDDLPG